MRATSLSISALALILSIAPALAQPDRAAAPGGFRHAVPGWRFEFPRDHGSHEEFRTEWWYFTGQLRTEGGRRFGFELSFFRVGVRPPGPAPSSAWDLRNLALAHFAISDLDRKEFRYHEKLNRASRYTASSAEGRLDLFNENWRAAALPDGRWSIRAAAEGDAIDLVLRALKPPAIHGRDGISVKGPERGAASHYYSMTRLEAAGTIDVGDGAEACRGQAWMDHEFSTTIVAEDQVGWDWFSLQLDDGTELMLYQLRRSDGSIDPASSGSFIAVDGSVAHLGRDDLAIEPRGRWRSPVSGAVYPMGWDVRVPARGLALRVVEEMRDQELVTAGSTGMTYWEGAVRVTGRSSGRAVRGAGYVEMTGYAEPFSLPTE
ncbi:MAG TPA: lipocalin-like domain-containing protein [Thermoanaerobaculia bacterium]|nr:lipocalin-like domain-containing protein [Thermoanaerobaculia bacterium]